MSGKWGLLHDPEMLPCLLWWYKEFGHWNLGCCHLSCIAYCQGLPSPGVAAPIFISKAKSGIKECAVDCNIRCCRKESARKIPFQQHQYGCSITAPGGAAKQPVTVREILWLVEGRQINVYGQLYSSGQNVTLTVVVKITCLHCWSKVVKMQLQQWWSKSPKTRQLTRLLASFCCLCQVAVGLELPRYQ